MKAIVELSNEEYETLAKNFDEGTGTRIRMFIHLN